MKQSIFIFITSLLATYSFTQQQLQNPGFEDWENLGTATAEPTNWSSLKTGDALASAAPEVLSQVSGRNGGFAAQLKVIDFGFPFPTANGIMTNGRIHADLDPENGYVYTIASDQKWHTSFTSRPDSIAGWYKYAPQSGDQGKIEIILHTGPNARLPRTAGATANEIGNARFDFTTTQTDWTRFSTPFRYYTQDAPEYVLTTITAGDSTLSENDTKLIIDDLELIYNPTLPGDTIPPSDTSDPSAGLPNYNLNNVSINGSHGYLYFDQALGTNSRYSVADLTGKIVQAGNTQSKVLFRHEEGIYFIYVTTENNSFRRKLYITQ
ncbi:hypothetical protein CW751_11205 [Brumimicrobium salinarum]|uniref:Uncharacterized protein n=1 Tax=Brumimicrobium salinarum TaxID=2058658 RepID=A0A2I0R0V5_9FLAO|nr:PCMD domain-containing protein [Brumimicrobium salinarum]PKR80222.1 hypothetical protein CW751_11205 [Brumimicrobium salinarum]